MSNGAKISFIRRKYKDQWVAVEVTQRDEFHAPTAGKVLFHHPDEEKVYDFGFQFYQQHPKKELFFFFTGEPVPKEMEVVLGTIRSYSRAIHPSRITGDSLENYEF